MKVCIVNGSFAYRALFTSYGFEVVDGLIDGHHAVDLVVFTGGADVSPGLYGHEHHHTTYNDVFRDQMEAQAFERCSMHDIPMVGICRGQFLNVMSGGEMYQDVSGHGMPHEITDLVTGETVYVSSTHHQMMKPSQGLWWLLATLGVIASIGMVVFSNEKPRNKMLRLFSMKTLVPSASNLILNSLVLNILGCMCISVRCLNVICGCNEHTC